MYLDLEGDSVSCGSEVEGILQVGKSSNEDTSVKEDTHSTEGISKKEKAKRKKEKKLQKEKDKILEKEKLKESMADLPSQREQELEQLNCQLQQEGFEVKNVASDGHCLYRLVVFR